MMFNEIFCFGSNEAGIHGAGAAKYAAKYYGASYGIGNGRTGNAYAIPTKNKNIQTLPLDKINIYVKQFIEYAIDNPNLIFNITRIGCGLAGYTDGDIAPMFANAPNNCKLDANWILYIERLKND